MNAVGLYPPLFYAAMGLLVGPDVETSVLLMRLVNATLFLGLLTGTFFALPRRLRPALIISALATSVPLGMFVIASTNPSSWAYASALTVWITLLASLHSTGRRQLVLAVLAVGAAALGAGARADASAFAILAVGLAGVLGIHRSRALLVPAIAAVVIIAISIAFFFSSGQSRSLSSGLPNLNPPLTGGQHLENLVGVPSLWFGALGGWGLGWLDTLMPPLVPTLAFAVFTAAVFIGIHRLSWRRGIAVCVALAAMWLVPFALLAQSRALVGSEVQPRYVLPLMAIFLGVACATALAAAQWRGVRMATAGATLTVAMSLALHVNIRRYTVGADDNALDPGAHAEWWWSAAPAPIIVWIATSAAFGAAIVLLWIANKEGAPACIGTVAATETGDDADPLTPEIAKTSQPVSGNHKLSVRAS